MPKCLVICLYMNAQGAQAECMELPPMTLPQSLLPDGARFAGVGAYGEDDAYLYTIKGEAKAKAAPVTDETLLDHLITLARKDKGMEVNTSGIGRCGVFLPDETYLRRFKELGGQIVTVGSDAHRCDRVGQYSFEACRVLKDIFGHVCTFQDRNPIFHKF